MLTNFAEFIASLENMNVAHNSDKLTVADKFTMNTVYGNVKAFMTDHNLIPQDQMSALEDIQFDRCVRNFSGVTSLEEIGQEQITELCTACGIVGRDLIPAAESVALAIHNYQNGYNASKHFEASSPSKSFGDFEKGNLTDMFTPGAISAHIPTTAAALESFGQDIANTISDAKVAITVSILRYHRSALHRLIPNIPTDSNMVMYTVDNMEVYDLTKSQSLSSVTRYDDASRIPFVSLYNDPSPANTELKPITLLTANDAGSPNNLLIQQDVVKIGASLNMFDYALNAGVIGYNAVDFTDLVADNVRIKTLYLQVNTTGVGAVTEIVPINVIDMAGARMLMSANNLDSGDRICSLTDIVSLDKHTLLIDGSVSTLLTGLSVDGAVQVSYQAFGQINLKTSNVVVQGTAKVTQITITGAAPLAADTTLFGTLSFSLVGYTVEAQFSEENIRKSTKAMRIMTKQVGYEIPGSANYIVQYSLTQTRPEAVIDALTKLMSIGIDDRGLKLIMNVMNNVFDRIKQEAALTKNNYVYKVGNSFVAGQRVNPYIWLDTFDVSAFKNIRSGDYWGDVRSFVEAYLLQVVSKIYRQSYYQQELGNGEKAQFNVITSIPIKDALLSVPHYHNHLRDTAADAVADGAVEFRRTLPDGTVLNVISTTFAYMDDTMLILPVRPQRPQSVLNFGHNRERGTYLTQATPTINNAIVNSLIGNSREIPIITNPVGAFIKISNLSTVFAGYGVLG